ncbi:MAG: xanthine dehydrogenase family protein molybdopterin-binding subunit [Myxococcales bacterium]|nr:xanthine dehydrogenase family protein molybdopterin-binding subunit [Myxococcales bacterium]
MPELFTVNRRQALTWLGAAGAFTLGLRLAPSAAAAKAAPAPAADNEARLFITLHEDGRALLTCHRSEMGQHVWTAMAQILADELEADWDRVVIVQAPGDAKYGDQNTDGSRSVRRNLDRLRRAGATMRAMLQAAAAARWMVPTAECVAAAHQVTHRPTGRTLGYGALAHDAARQPIPSDVPLKPRAEWRYIGKAVPGLTVPHIVRGEGTFGIDVALPGMLHAVIARPPRLYATLARHDAAAARAIPGVVRVVELPRLEAPPKFKPFGGLAVVARDTWSAIRGRAALTLTWTDGPNAGYDSDRYRDALAATAHKPGTVRRNRGDAPKAIARAARRVEADYSVPHLAHCSMEPPAATARWHGDRVEVWACVQAPQEARQTVAEVCGVPLEAVTINVTWLGGAFGRKSKPDFVAEAALVARAAGAPVKVTWTREDDLTHDYFHTVSHQRLEGALDDTGRCVAWLHRTVFPPIASTFQAGADEAGWGDLQQGATDTPFDIPDLRVETGEAEAHVRIGWLRSVANIYHAFAVQSFAAELAAAAGRDGKDYLLDLIGPPRRVDPREGGAQYDNYGEPLDAYPIDTARLAHVTRVAADMAGWDHKRKAKDGKRGLGIAAHRSFLTYVATVIEVEVIDDRLVITGAWSAMDAGTVVNLDSARSQLEGGTLFGLSNALYGEITARKGAIVQQNFPDWRLMRIDEAPRHVEVRVIDSDAPPGGVGEPPTPPAAPALCNAIADATGTRIRSLPIFRAHNPNRLSAR